MNDDLSNVSKISQDFQDKNEIRFKVLRFKFCKNCTNELNLKAADPAANEIKNKKGRI